MSTTLAKPAEMADRKWYVIDAAGKPLGRVAAKAAVILRGKNKTTFTPNVDCGDHVIIINCDEAGEEVPSHSFRLDRRPEGDPVQDPDG